MVLHGCSMLLAPLTCAPVANCHFTLSSEQQHFLLTHTIGVLWAPICCLVPLCALTCGPRRHGCCVHAVCIVLVLLCACSMYHAGVAACMQSIMLLLACSMYRAGVAACMQCIMLLLACSLSCCCVHAVYHAGCNVPMIAPARPFDRVFHQTSGLDKAAASSCLHTVLRPGRCCLWLLCLCAQQCWLHYMSNGCGSAAAHQPCV